MPPVSNSSRSNFARRGPGALVTGGSLTADLSSGSSANDASVPTVSITNQPRWGPVGSPGFSATRSGSGPADGGRSAPCDVSRGTAAASWSIGCRSDKVACVVATSSTSGARADDASDWAWSSPTAPVRVAAATSAGGGRSASGSRRPRRPSGLASARNRVRLVGRRRVENTGRVGFGRRGDDSFGASGGSTAWQADIIVDRFTWNALPTRPTQRATPARPVVANPDLQRCAGAPSTFQTHPSPLHQLHTAPYVSGPMVLPRRAGTRTARPFVDLTGGG